MPDSFVMTPLKYANNSIANKPICMMVFPNKNTLKVSEVSCFLIEKAIIPIARSSNPVSLVQTKVPTKGSTPLLSNKVVGNNIAKSPTENAMIEAIVKKFCLLIIIIIIEQQRFAGNI